MLRLYLDATHEVRLHVWDTALAVPGVSRMHTHPWDFTSVIVAGRLRQCRYFPVPAHSSGSERFNRVEIQCGANAHTVSDPVDAWLKEGVLETYPEGEAYTQYKDEIHQSFPEDGTVTLGTRVFYPDREHASVYWRGTSGWTDAKPRPATPDEVDAVCRRALETWW
jgi:hypothetical protein